MSRSVGRVLVLVIAAQVMTIAGAWAGSDACSGARYHDFDFFLGRWTVKNASGRLLGSDVVEKTMGGCAIEEHWTDGSGPGRGYGVMAYRSGDGTWQQTFLDNDGMVLVFEGRRANGVMTFDGVDYSKSGDKRLHRVSFEPKMTGGLQERWRMSVDGGKTWRVVFDGLFKHAK